MGGDRVSPALMLLVMYLGPFLFVLLLIGGVRNLARSAGARRRAATVAMLDTTEGHAPLIPRLDRRFRRTRVGSWLARELAQAGSTQRPVVVAALALAVSVLSFVVIWNTLAPLLAFVGLLIGYGGMRWYVKHSQERRREAFIAQLPELARVLSNATHAGLSLPTALAVAAQEIDEPASTELRRVSDSVRFGRSPEVALAEISERMPSREVRILVSTLVISNRTGGALVSSLRNIADTLEDRKETRREIRTTLAQSMATAYTIVAIALGVLLLLNTMLPGSVAMMTTNPIGIVALVVSGALFTGGFLTIRHMARIEP